MSTAKWHWHCRKAAVGSQTGKIHRFQELPHWHILLRRDEETPSACITGRAVYLDDDNAILARWQQPLRSAERRLLRDESGPDKALVDL